MADRDVYTLIARALRDFGYPNVTPTMIAEVHLAMRAKNDIPHGVVGMFAQSQLTDAEEKGLFS